uniref:Macaca fascicularis brain cDNA, clone: QflA-19807 n=1 Tax=Macaca fascicularis TaxID=9541 RepID=I7GLX9_MACFA|nr:unnamed protein product [Macaca fascicularis]
MGMRLNVIRKVTVLSN